MTYMYPILLSLFPAINLFTTNKISIAYALPTWLMIGGGVGVLVLLANLILHDPQKSAVLVAFFSISFFYFEIFLDQLGLAAFNLGIVAERTALQFSLSYPPVIFLIWLVLLMNAARMIAKSKTAAENVNKYLSVVSVILVIYPSLAIGRSLWEEGRQAAPASSAPLPASQEGFEAGPELTGPFPDLYYLVFDGFGGQDILNSSYETDIKEFVEQLQERGFYVPALSRSNYSQTILSLPSSLNMRYLDDVAAGREDSSNWDPLAALVQNNRVSTYLDGLGYDLVVFSSGYWVTESVQADHKLSPDLNLNEYQEVYLLNTPIVRFFPGLLYDLHRARIQYTLDEISQVPRTGDPIFVFAHTFTPHPPFVFDRDGNPVHPPRPYSKFDADGFLDKGGTAQEYKQMYSQQADYLFGQILSMIDEIRAASDTQPIIIVQGDHGPGSEVNQESLEETNLQERFSIMNAYYFPGQDYDSLYSAITPVNTFRVVFNQYFGADFPLLEDQQYFSSFSYPYQLEEVTQMLE